MGIMTRLLRLCKADVHGVMDQLEDKQLLLKQYSREMEASLDRKKRQIAALSQRRIEMSNRTARHNEEMRKLEEDLELAVEKEKDDIARALIRRRRILDSTCRLLQAQLETLTQQERELTATVTDQRVQYEALKTKSDAYCLRAGHSSFPSAADPIRGDWTPIDPKEEEIELELLQRKQALQKGGTP